jgi:hypothetical protein
MSAPLTRLPTELVASCLKRLDSLRWFSSALVSHRLFHVAYTEQPSIVVGILKNQIPSALLPFALAVHNVSQLRDWEPSSACALLDDLYSTSLPEALVRISRLKLSDAVRISQMHSIVQGFCDKFAASAFKELYGTDAAHERLVLSSDENFRIMRALYRAELYWGLFARESNTKFHSSVAIMKNGFFDRHSPWANEQLACVHDFLERELCKCKQFWSQNNGPG